MKKLTFLFALIMSSSFVFATDQGTTLARANYENTKMYRQPGTSTEVLKSLKSTDQLVVIRKHNPHWSIVTVEGQVGYVLTSELHQAKEDRSIALARTARKK
jgi:uncharacterized protein YgiM (DUF1202 family)